MAEIRHGNPPIFGGFLHELFGSQHNEYPTGSNSSWSLQKKVAFSKKTPTFQLYPSPTLNGAIVFFTATDWRSRP
jgi:hypothetical protein